MSPGRGVSDYRELLTLVYGFEAPLEAALAYTPHLGALIDLRGRYRSGLIVEDLLALGLKPSQLAHSPQCMIAPFRGPAEALGWMYVVHRSTQLHEALRRHVTSQHPELAPATAYLSAFEHSVGTRTLELAHTLDDIARTPQLRQQIVAAAHDAFRRALDWYGVSTVIARGA